MKEGAALFIGGSNSLLKKLLKQILDFLLFGWSFLSRNTLSRSVVLCYHNLSAPNEASCPAEFVGNEDCVDVGSFEAQLCWLSGFCDFVSLEELLNPGTKDGGKRWKVSVTFDDGYKSVIDLGLPLFERYRAPITWFITTRFVEEPNFLPWWDLLAFIAESWKETLEFRISGSPYCYDFAKPKERSAFLDDMGSLFKNASPSLREEAQSTIEERISSKLRLPANAMARKEEIRRASRSPWISIGGHTHSHLNMARCSEKELQFELERNRNNLKEWTGQEIEWFSYPFGKCRYLNSSAIESVRRAGYRGAVMTEMGYVNNSIDPYRIPRLPVPGEWGMLRFKSRFGGINIVRKLKRLGNRSDV